MSDAMELPPLPVPAIPKFHCDGHFTADQMRAYGEQCARAAVAADREAFGRDVMRAADSVMGIETDGMRGDNLAITLCSYFEDFADSPPGENGWSEEVTEKYEAVKDAICDHFRDAIRARTTP